MSTMTRDRQLTWLDTRGPFDLGELAMMGFGHRDERSFDGVVRLGFCLDGGFERQVGVEVRQHRDVLELTLDGGGDRLTAEEVDTVRGQVARVLSLDHDGQAFHQMCLADPALAAVHVIAPGFRPVLFYSPYEAAVWALISARRARPQGIRLRTRLAETYGTTFTLAGVPTAVVPTPSALLQVQELPGLPADRIPRLHAVATAAQQGLLEAGRLRGLDPGDAAEELQRLPGVGPFYSALVLVRASGHADLPSLQEERSRDAISQLYGLGRRPTDAELLELEEQWRPFRTWVSVMVRALYARSGQSVRPSPGEAVGAGG